LSQLNHGDDYEGDDDQHTLSVLNVQTLGRAQAMKVLVQFIIFTIYANGTNKHALQP
jgi:hypothetical protein